MADVNYVSPASLLPQQTPMQLPAFMQGMQYHDQMQDYRNAQSLSDLMSRMAATKQSGELQDWQTARPSALASTIATNTATANTVGDLRRGEADKALAGGRVAMGTANSDIATKIAENVTKQGEAGREQLNTMIRLAQMAGAAQGPQGAAQVMQQASQMNIDPQHPLIQMAIKDPQRAQQFLMSIDDKVQGKLITDTNDQGLKNYGNERVANITGQYHVQAAKIAADAAKARVDAMLTKQSPDQLEAQLTARILAYQQAGQQPPDELVAMVDNLRQRKISVATAGAQQNQQGTQAATQGAIPAGAPVQAPPILPTAKPQIKVGQTMTIPNAGEVTIVAQNPDGSYKIQNKAGRTGTWRP